MTPLLQSFLCGMCFVLGALVTACFAFVILQLSTKKGREELNEHWKQSLATSAAQVRLLERICLVMENRQKKNDP